MATSNLGKDEDDTKIREPRGDASSLTKYLQIMNSYGREIIFVIALVFTGIAAIQNGPLKTKKVNPPGIFFAPPSLVTDFYQGNVQQLLSLQSEKDVSLVVYYAPWDAACIQAKEEIETVAKFYHNEVFFAAINCWWPEGECRKKFSVPSFPVVLVYIHEIGIVRYEGPLISTYIISFLDFVLTPLVPLHHTGELLDLLTKHEGVLVAFFEFKDGSYPNGYKQFYSAAVKSLNTDPNRRICFAVITNRKDALHFKLKSDIQLFLWNSTEVYSEEVLNHLEILKWAYSNLKQVTQWISPPGVKSKILSENIEKNAALVLFTPRNLLLEYSPYYNLGIDHLHNLASVSIADIKYLYHSYNLASCNLSSIFKEVALDYFNCNKGSFVESLIHRLVLKRHILQEEFSRIIGKCHRNSSDNDPNVCRKRPDMCDLTCCQPINLDLNFRQTCACRACLHHIVEDLKDMKLSECENTLNLILRNFNLNELGHFRNCSEIEVSYPVKFGPYKQLSFNCETESPHSGKSSKRELTEKEIAELKDDLILTMIQNTEKRLCHRLRYALNYSELNFPSFPTSDNSSWLSNFTGLGCRTNKTLAFIAMDVVLYHSFAENMGIDVTKNYHQTTAVIIETVQESQYVLDGHINKKVLVEFIKNYTAGNLDRHLRMPVRKLEGCGKDENANVCVEEVTTATFSEIVLDKTKDVVLMYYASWCGACYSVSHIFLSVADYFSNVEGIKFARISGEDNDLPWEHTVEKYPTIIFFPAERKSESVEFPPHLSITLTNLLHFVLVHTQPRVRWTVAMEMCNRDCIAYNLIMSAKELRRLFREHRILLNNLHFVQKTIYGPKRPKSSVSKPKGVKEPSMSYLKSVYIPEVVYRIHKKRAQIKQALQLQSVLRKKRNIYLKEKKNGSLHGAESSLGKSAKKSKYVAIKQKIKKDEL